jgi:hypothetical protein
MRSVTKSQIRKQKKRKDRERRITHAAHLRHNVPSNKYRLDVCLDGVWHLGVMAFKTWYDVLSYKDGLEDKRSKGSGVIAGRIVCLRTGNIEMVIEHSPAKPMKGVLPDKLADNPYAAEKAVIDSKPKSPYSI